MSFVDDTMIIDGYEFGVKIGKIEQIKLRYYEENPRIYSLVQADSQHLDQGEIEEILLNMEHVKGLVQDIKKNGGLIDPVIVKDKTFEVLEGNSRLASYRFLSKADPAKWAHIKCAILPHDLNESFIFSLLGQYHITGKKDWAPYEQAGFLYRRCKDHKIPRAELAKALGIPTRKVNQLINTYEFMIKANDNSVNRWSYYEEYIKSNKIKKMRDQFPGFDETFIRQVKRREIKKAVDVREKLPKLSHGSKGLQKKFSDGQISLDDAFERLDASGSLDKVVLRVKQFRDFISDGDTLDGISAMDKSEKLKLGYEFRKMEPVLNQVKGRLK